MSIGPANEDWFREQYGLPASDLDDRDVDAPVPGWTPPDGFDSTTVERPVKNGQPDAAVVPTLGDHLHVLNLAEMLSSEPEPPSWTWHRYLERGTLGMLHGDGGIGKSLFALGLARAVTRGEPFLGWPTQQGRVIYLDAENPLARSTGASTASTSSPPRPT